MAARIFWSPFIIEPFAVDPRNWFKPLYLKGWRTYLAASTRPLAQHSGYLPISRAVDPDIVLNGEGSSARPEGVGRWTRLLGAGPLSSVSSG